MNPELLYALQRGLPLTRRPFADVAERLGSSEADVLTAIRALLADGTARRIGAVFDARRLGYRSALCAMRLAPAELPRAAGAVSRQDGVTHCYERGWPAELDPGLPGAPAGRDLPNLWFTLAAPGAAFDAELGRLRDAVAPHPIRVLPAERRFKIDVVFDLRDRARGETFPGAPSDPATPGEEPVPLDALDWQIVNTVQGSLPLEPDPFGAVAQGLGIPPAELLARLEAWRARGLLRRVALVVRHERCGLKANGMCVWDVPDARVLKAGRGLARHAEVTHCYQRVRDADVGGNLYAMIHGTAWAAVHALFRRLSEAEALSGGRLLCSLREFKKTSMRYLPPTA